MTRARTALPSILLTGALLLAPIGIVGCDATNPAEELSSEIVGIWHLTDAAAEGDSMKSTNALEENGMLSVLTINEDGTGETALYQYGENTVDDGTFVWEVSEDGTTATMTLNDKVSTIEVDEDELIVTAEDQSRLRWERMDSDELEEAIAESRNAFGEPVSLGETVSTETYEFVIDSAGVEQAIYPPDTSGYYSYYEADPGQQFYVARGTFKNLDTSFSDIKYGTSATLIVNNEYEYSAQVEGAVPGDTGFFSHQPEPLTSVQVTIFASVPEEVVGDISSATLQWKFTDDLGTYYSDSSCTNTYAIQLQ